MDGWIGYRPYSANKDKHLMSRNLSITKKSKERKDEVKKVKGNK